MLSTHPSRKYKWVIRLHAILKKKSDKEIKSVRTNMNSVKRKKNEQIKVHARIEYFEKPKKTGCCVVSYIFHN